MWLYHMFVDDVFLMLLFIKNTRDYLRGFIISSGGSRNDFLRRGVGISKTYFRYFCYTCKFLGVGDYGQFSFLIRSAHIKLIWFMLFWNFHLKKICIEFKTILIILSISRVMHITVSCQGWLLLKSMRHTWYLPGLLVLSFILPKVCRALCQA